MISTHLIGGLGNQMFQIANALAEAYRNNDDACFDLNAEVYKGQGNNPSFYKESVFSKLCSTPETNCKYMNNGYYQSEKHFIEYKDKIIDMFTNMEIVNSLINKYPLNNSLSVHVRRGDYLGLQHYHPCPSMEYYQQALSLIEADNILVFSDDIEWCKKNFKNVIFVEGQKDYEDLYLMSLCKHHIIANSSFSWWGAYLSRDENVIAPKLWFGSAISNWNDIYCEKWIVI